MIVMITIMKMIIIKGIQMRKKNKLITSVEVSEITDVNTDTTSTTTESKE